MRTSRCVLRQARRALWLALALATGIHAAMLALPMLLLALADEAVLVRAPEFLVALAGVLICGVLGISIVEFCNRRILLRAGLWLDHVMRTHLGANSGLSNHRSSLHSAMRLDVEQDLRRVVDTFRAPEIVRILDLPGRILLLLALVLIDFRLGLTACVVVVALVLIAALQSGTDAIEADAVVEPDTPHPLDKALGLDAELLRRAALGRRQWLAATYSLEKAATRRLFLADAVRRTGEIALACLGVLLVARGELSIAMASAALLLATWTVGGFHGLVGAAGPVGQAFRAYRRLAGAQPAAGQSLTEGRDDIDRGAIWLRDVSFTHAGHERPVIHCVSLSVPRGKALAITGSAGSGKSTLAALCAGALLPTKGSVTLGGLATSQTLGAPSGVTIGYAPDQPRLLDGTVRQNIVRFTEDGDATAVRAADAAGVRALIERLPDGYETRVGPDGCRLALRERRAVGLARALSGNPDLVVLDAPEAGLSEFGVRQLAANLRRLRDQGSTIVIATTEPLLIAIADHGIELPPADATARPQTAIAARSHHTGHRSHEPVVNGGRQ